MLLSDPRSEHARGARRGALHRVPLAALACAAALACNQESGPTVSEIAADPARWDQQVVSFEGVVATIHAPGLFVLAADDPAEEILVYSGSRTEDLREGEPVRVNGPVRVLTAEQIETSLALELPPELAAREEPTPILLDATVTARVESGGLRDVVRRGGEVLRAGTRGLPDVASGPRARPEPSRPDEAARAER